MNEFIKKIEQNGYFLKNIKLCGHNEEIEKFGNYFITLSNNKIINVIAISNEKGYYFKILSIYDENNNRKYTNARFLHKYILLVQDKLFDFIKNKKR